MLPLQGKHLTASFARSCPLFLPTGHPSLSSANLSPRVHLQAEIPPRVQTLSLAWGETTTQTHRAAKVSASLLLVHQGGPLPQQSQTSRAAKAGEGHLREDACGSGSSLPCGCKLGEQQLDGSSSEVQRPIPAQGKGSEQQETTTPGEGSPPGLRDSVLQSC